MAVLVRWVMKDITVVAKCFDFNESARKQSGLCDVDLGFVRVHRSARAELCCRHLERDCQQIQQGTDCGEQPPARAWKFVS